jgi:1,4-dihydroxy-6-naphthoate synthase
VLVPGENTTANFLLDHYAGRPLRKRFLPFDALYAELCAVPGTQGVVIHEKRFTYRQDGLRLIADLGEHWEQCTGYAIPLGAIIARKSLGLEAQLEALIRRSLQWAYANYEAAFSLCREYAADLSEGVIEAHIRLYVNHYSENLGAEGEATIAYFFAQQARFLAGGPK